MRAKAKILAAVLLFLAFSQSSFSEENIVIIAGKNLSIEKIQPGQIKALFLGENRYLDGKLVEIGERDRTSEIYKDFYRNLAAMTPKDISVHWAKKIFTGEAMPPSRIAGDDEAAKNWISTRPNAISYIYAKNADKGVRVLGTVERP